MRRIICLIFFLPAIQVAGQWIPTSIYYGDQPYSLTSSGQTIYLSGNLGVSMYSASTCKWRIASPNDMQGQYPLVTGNDHSMMCISEGRCLVSRDTGLTWTEYPFPSTPYRVGFLDEIMVVFDFSGKMYYSDDYGANWRLVTNDLPDSYDIVPCISSQEVLVVVDTWNWTKELYRTTFNGDSFSEWSYVRSFDLVEPIPVMICEHDTLYAPFQTGIMYSTDIGENWFQLGEATSMDFHELCGDGANIYTRFGNGTGIGQYDLQTQEWTELQPASFFNSMTGIAACQGYFCALGLFSDYKLKIHDDEGWIPPPALPVGDSANGISSAKSTGDLILTTKENEGGIIIYWSDNEGTTWNYFETDHGWAVRDAIRTGAGYFIAGENGIGKINFMDKTITPAEGLSGLEAYSFLSTSSGNLILAGTDHGIFVTDNYGENWQYKYLAGIKVFALLVHQDTLFAGTDQGLYVLKHGEKWQEAECPAMEIRTLASDMQNLYTGTASGILKRDLVEKCWYPMMIPSAGTNANRLMAQGNHLFAATSLGRIFCSEDGGITWTDLSSPLFSDITDMFIMGATLFVADRLSGVFYYSVGSPGGLGYQDIGTLAIHPNPAKDHILIEFPERIAPGGLIEILDARGIVLKSVKAGSTNTQSIYFDTKDLTPGMYILRFMTGTARFSGTFFKTD